jgi:glycosyltransferase involved in cell wall biosynthesis
LWVGRMVSWKRVDLILSAAAWARTKGGNDFRLRIIGCGPEEEKIRLLTKSLGLADICEFDGPQSPEAIGMAMDAADIYVFPSDKNEGWGVVANEAMLHECCVIGSKNTGSIPYLIRNGINGFIFDDRNAGDLGKILRWCLDHPDQRQQIGNTARKTILDLWTPEVAAERLLMLIETIAKNETTPFLDGGPCSPA